MDASLLTLLGAEAMGTGGIEPRSLALLAPCFNSFEEILGSR